MTHFEELLPGAWMVHLNKMEDLRGSFVKTLSKSMLNKLGCDFEFHEEYYSTSKQGVIRGMHFQLPPHDHIKIVYCIAGSVLDVLLDLRLGPTYGKSCSVILEADVPKILILPKGVAHGFKSLSEDSVLVYKTSSEYSPNYDAGILWNSFNFSWEIAEPILSERDKLHPVFKNFKTPFSLS